MPFHLRSYSFRPLLLGLFAVTVFACDGGSDAPVQADTPAPDTSAPDAGSTPPVAVDAASPVDAGTDAPAPWRPLALGTRLSLWLDADVGVTVNAQGVAGWADQSAQPAHVANNATGTAPFVTYVPATPVAHAVLHFVNAGSTLGIFDTPSLDWYNRDFAVAFVGGSATGGNFVGRAASGACTSFIGLSIAMDPMGTFSFRIFPTSGVAHGVVTATSYMDGLLHVVVARRTGAIMELRVDGKSVSATVAPIDDESMGTNPTTLGMPTGNGACSSIAGFLGDLAEVVAVNGTLSDQELTALEGHLQAKTGH